MSKDIELASAESRVSSLSCMDQFVLVDLHMISNFLPFNVLLGYCNTDFSATELESFKLLSGGIPDQAKTVSVNLTNKGDATFHLVFLLRVS